MHDYKHGIRIAQVLLAEHRESIPLPFNELEDRLLLNISWRWPNHDLWTYDVSLQQVGTPKKAS